MITGSSIVRVLLTTLAGIVDVAGSLVSLLIDILSVTVLMIKLADKPIKVKI